MFLIWQHFKKSYFIIAALCFLIFLSACKKENLVPSYIHIDHISLNTQYIIDGSNSSKITDAWVYIDGNLQGVYELPATFPVLASGNHDIMIRPGIKLNGISMSRGYYPFYEPYQATINLEEKLTDTINPTVQYYAGKVQWNEDFEQGGISIQKFSDSDTTFVKTSQAGQVFEGSFSGVGIVNSTYPDLMAVSTETFTMPVNSSPVFLEMNYKCNNTFAVGLCAMITGQTTPYEVLILNPTDEWNKIYVNLTYAVTQVTATNQFKVFFHIYLDDGNSSGEVLIDNVKFVFTKP